MYSWMSRSTGFAAERHEPHAVDGLALLALFQMISPRIKKPKDSKSVISNE